MNTLISRLLIALTILVSCVGVLAPRAAFAADDGSGSSSGGSPTWSLAPTATPGAGQAGRSAIVVNASPGDQISDSVTLYNPTDVPVQIQLFTSDAFNVKNGGGFALNTSPQPTKDAGAWISLPVVQFSVDAKTGVKIPFTIAVPANASPGDHSAGIVALGVAPIGTKQSGSTAIDVKRAVGTRVYVRVDGPTKPSLDIASMTFDPASAVLAPFGGGTNKISFVLSNTGNTRMSPTMRVWVTDALGRTVKSFPKFNVADLLPGNSATITRQWDGANGVALRLTAHAEAVAGKTTASASSSALAMPWLLLLLVLVVIALLVWWWRRRHGTRVAHRRNWADVQ